MKQVISWILFICILISYGMLLFHLTACSSGVGHASLSAPDERSVIDGSGAILEIPEDREETTLASVYAVAVPFIYALEITDLVLAINVKSKFWTDACENLAAAGTVGRGMVDLEALAGFAPDVLIHRSNDSATVEAVTEKLGIPVLCITVEDYDDITQTLTMMGRYFGREERAREVCEWLGEKFEMIDRIVAEIPEDARVSALVMGGELGRIAGSDMLQAWMIEKAGGIYVAEGITKNKAWVDVGVEEVFKWNPDFIFCTSSTPLDYSVDGLLNDSAWSAMEAVKEKNIYEIPAKIDSWDMPGVSCAIGTMYLLHNMYPSYFTAGQMQEEIDEYYLFMFGKTFDKTYLGYELDGL